MPRLNNFRIQSRYVLLTYSQCMDLDPQSIVRHITTLGGQCVIGRENHADGGIHYHAFVDFGRKFSTRDVRCFDVDDKHPNVLRGYQTPEKMWDYATKDGQLVHDGLQRPDPESGTRATASFERWAHIIAAPTRGEFFDRIAQSDPRSLCVSYTSISKYADDRYREQPQEYNSPNYTWDNVAIEQLVQWVGDNIDGYQPGIR